MGRSAEQPQDQLDALVARILGSQATSPFYTPGLAVVIERRGQPIARAFAGTDGAGRPIREDTLFHLASASKLATGLVLLRLVDEGKLDVDASLGDYLPRAAAARPDVTIRRLMSHTSGLPLEVSSTAVEYGPALNWRALAEVCLETPLAAPPGTRVQYSNVAYGLLGLVVERLLNVEYPPAVRRLVLEPLGIDASTAQEASRPAAWVADIDSPHVGSDLEPFNSAFSQRLGMPWSSVITTADGMLALVKVYAGSRPDLLSPALAAHATADQTHGLGGGFGSTDPFMGFNGSRSITWPHCPWGLAVEVRGDKRPHWTPPLASQGSFGQIGSSGCLAWYDPKTSTAWAFAGARTTDNGWLLRHGAAIGTIALAKARIAA